jgi:hypothetical protein
MSEKNFMMKSEVFGSPSLVSDLVQSVDQKICERQRFKISELSCESPQISHTVLYETMTARLGYRHKFCTRWVLKMLMGVHKTQRMASALTFLEQYQQNDNEFLNNIFQVAGGET